MALNEMCCNAFDSISYGNVCCACLSSVPTAVAAGAAVAVVAAVVIVVVVVGLRNVCGVGEGVV